MHVLDRTLLRGLSYEVAELYGKPHLGSHYTSYDIDHYKLDEEALCANCGKPADGTHHSPPKGRGRKFELVTDGGVYILQPALIALCGSGTTGCHGMVHNRHIEVFWRWNSDEYFEKWWKGEFFKEGIMPHDQRLFDYGKYEFVSDSYAKRFMRRPYGAR